MAQQCLVSFLNRYALLKETHSGPWHNSVWCILNRYALLKETHWSMTSQCLVSFLNKQLTNASIIMMGLSGDLLGCLTLNFFPTTGHSTALKVSMCRIPKVFLGLFMEWRIDKLN